MSRDTAPGSAIPGTPASITRPLRVLHIIPTLGVGGTERQLVQLLTRMDRTRFRQTVCYYTRSVTFESTLNEAGIDTIFIDKVALAPWTFLARLRRVVREVGPDLVHTWLFSGNFWGRVAGFSCGVPVLVSSDRCIAEPASFAVVLYERFFAARTTRLTNSRAAAESLHARYGLDPRTIRVIPNGVQEAPEPSEDARREARAALGLPATAPVVLMIARQAMEKNHPMFFRAARRVVAERPDAIFLAVGHLFDPAAMQRMVEASGASGIVRVVEQREDVSRWLAAADLFCLTSNREGLPNAVLEAMAAGLPVLCAEFPSAREVMPVDDVGRIIPVDDDAALAREILTLLADEVCRRRLGANARRFVREAFGWDRLVREMESLYTNLAGARRRGNA